MSRSSFKPVIAVVAIGSAALVLWLTDAPFWLQALVASLRGLGWVGVLLFTVAYVGATVSTVPGSILTVGAGFAYGPLWGTLLVSPVSVVAATVSFLLARGVARDWVSERVRGDPRFLAIDRAVGEQGLQLVLLLRLSPVFPFNLLNYALGLTRVRLRDYILGSFVGMLPGTLVFVYLGSAVSTASELAGSTPGSAVRLALYGLGGIATLLVTVVVTRMARRALATALQEKAS